LSYCDHGTVHHDPNYQAIVNDEPSATSVSHLHTQSCSCSSPTSLFPLRSLPLRYHLFVGWLLCPYIISGHSRPQCNYFHLFVFSSSQMMGYITPSHPPQTLSPITSAHAHANFSLIAVLYLRRILLMGRETITHNVLIPLYCFISISQRLSVPTCDCCRGASP
jgi:hypothetical protein